MHPFQQALTPYLKWVWLAALDDVKISSAQALLVTQPGTASHAMRCAVYMRRGVECEPEGLDDDLLAELNSPTNGCVDAHRVVLWTDRRSETAAALIRHELEHARQIDLRPEVEELHDLAADVVTEDRANSGRLYQQIPAETDANAAAGVWVRSLFGNERIDRVIEEGDPNVSALRSSEPPASPADLPERMVDFFVSIEDLCRRWSERHNFTDFPSFLDLAWRGAGTTWTERTA